jgi:hypothetical protein
MKTTVVRGRSMLLVCALLSAVVAGGVLVSARLGRSAREGMQ